MYEIMNCKIGFYSEHLKDLCSFPNHRNIFWQRQDELNILSYWFYVIQKKVVLGKVRYKITESKAYQNARLEEAKYVRKK